jgi:hypothetical protein
MGAIPTSRWHQAGNQVNIKSNIINKVDSSQSGRRESNPHYQLGRLETNSGRPVELAALTRRYGISIPLRCPFWVEIWVENRRRLKSVDAGAVQSRSVHRDTADRRLVVSGVSARCSYLGEY